jgi:hypothetical protein
MMGQHNGTLKHNGSLRFPRMVQKAQWYTEAQAQAKQRLKSDVVVADGYALV